LDWPARASTARGASPARPHWRYGNMVAAIAFSPDRRLVALGGRGGAVQLRDVDSGKEINTWQAYAHDMWVWSLAFTPDGRTLLTSGKFAGRLWRVPDGRPVGELME